ncbi:MAG TPA: hypothetical protein VGW34_11825 [Allosphingosinicella sp.]|nr:hypothetical protein [Allosphingosinicella sp.]
MDKSKTMISLIAFLSMASLSSPAHAYLDPATGSIILQATLGAIAGGTLFFRTSLYKVKALFAPRAKADAAAPSDAE